MRRPELCLLAALLMLASCVPDEPTPIVAAETKPPAPKPIKPEFTKGYFTLAKGYPGNMKAKLVFTSLTDWHMAYAEGKKASGTWEKSGSNRIILILKGDPDFWGSPIFEPYTNATLKDDVLTASVSFTSGIDAINEYVFVRAHNGF